jgi:hypothetical protein
MTNRSVCQENGRSDSSRVTDPALARVARKVSEGLRLELHDGLACLETTDLLGLGALALAAKSARFGSRAFYVVNHHQLLRTSYALGRVQAQGVAVEASRITGLPEAAIGDYYRKLAYDLDERLWTGLTRFLGLLGYRAGRLERFGENWLELPSKEIRRHECAIQ